MKQKVRIYERSIRHLSLKENEKRPFDGHANYQFAL